MDIFETQARFLKALTHPARLSILAVLRDDQACVCHLEAVLGYRQAVISQHLMILRGAGLVADERVGSNVFYRVTDRRVFRVLDALCDKGAPQAVFARPHAHCPCPTCTAARAGKRKAPALVTAH